ncbi:hypothetical protein GcC1_083032 [Golovinomyces cichoracearum]|uniref:Uncharacterized protein n=1 Tax=Golovinomyces cichoracearum TaxID=62708 RepID=A0A420IJH0_9PEZI|nr:hypothetical protein GcC1_083032 [Golovinomyces cichoracearum]
MLRNSEDWEAFWFSLQGVANLCNDSVFKLVDISDEANLMRDPELSTILRAPDLPQKPTVTGTVTEAQVEQTYKIMLTEHRFQHAAYADEKARVTKILDKYEGLNRLPLMKWLDHIQWYYDKAVECELPEVTGFRSHYDVTHAIRNIDIEYSKKSGKIPQTVIMIEDFSNRQRQEEAMKSLKNPYFAKNLPEGVATTFKASKAEDRGSKTTYRDDKECLCGLKHSWSNCRYLNPSTRPN